MHKLLPALFALLPVCGLGFLAAAGSALPRSTLTSPVALESRQQKPASLNKTCRVILAAQYRFYQRNRYRPDLAARAATLYNQCAADSDPSALRGTGLPPHIQ